jgi:hypothetical protein
VISTVLGGITGGSNFGNVTELKLLVALVGPPCVIEVCKLNPLINAENPRIKAENPSHSHFLNRFRYGDLEAVENNPIIELKIPYIQLKIPYFKLRIPNEFRYGDPEAVENFIAFGKDVNLQGNFKNPYFKLKIFLISS